MLRYATDSVGFRFACPVPPRFGAFGGTAPRFALRGNRRRTRRSPPLVIRLSKSTDYALMALADLALLPRGETLSARRVAEDHHLPRELAAKVLQGLKKSGLVETRQGMRGGYRLARAPEEIRITEVIESIEGPLALVECLLDDNTCLLTCSCSVRAPLHRIHERLLATLSDLTLAQILADCETPGPPAGGPELPVLQ